MKLKADKFNNDGSVRKYYIKERNKKIASVGYSVLSKQWSFFAYAPYNAMLSDCEGYATAEDAFEGFKTKAFK